MKRFPQLVFVDTDIGDDIDDALALALALLTGSRGGWVKYRVWRHLATRPGNEPRLHRGAEMTSLQAGKHLLPL